MSKIIAKFIKYFIWVCITLFSSSCATLLAYNWLVLPVFTTLPKISISEMMGLLIFVFTVTISIKLIDEKP